MDTFILQQVSVKYDRKINKAMPLYKEDVVQEDTIRRIITGK